MSNRLPILLPLIFSSLCLVTTPIAVTAAEPDLDASFDGDGRAPFDLNGAESSDVDATAILVSASGYVGAVLTSHSVDGNEQNTLSILQYSTHGVESTLLRGSLVRPGESSLQGVVRMALRPDGRLVVATRALDPQTSALDMLVCRFRRGTPIATWIIDTGFGDGTGCRSIHTNFAPLPADQDTFLSDLALDSQGRVVLVGSARTGPGGDVSIPVAARLLADGEPDPAFGSGGIAAFAQIDNASFDNIVIDAQDRIVVSGSRYLSDTDADGFVMRLTTSGLNDSGFGYRNIAFDLGDIYDFDITRAVALEPDGEVTVLLVVVEGATVKPAIVRYTASGQPSPTLGGLSRRIVDMPGMIIERMAIRPDGSYLLAAEERPGIAGHGAIFALDRNGRLVCPFGDGDCVARPALDASSVFVQDLRLDAAGRPVLSAITGDSFSSGAQFARLQNRLLGDGFE